MFGNSSPQHGERIIAVKQVCADLIVHYAMLNDQHSYDELILLFCKHGMLRRPANPSRNIVGREAIKTVFMERPESRRSLHIFSNIYVKVLSDTEATASSTFMVYLWDKKEEIVDSCEFEVFTGQYEDSLQVEEGAWRFASRVGENYFTLGKFPGRLIG